MKDSKSVEKRKAAQGYPTKLVRRPDRYPNPENPMGSTKTKGK